MEVECEIILLRDVFEDMTGVKNHSVLVVGTMACTFCF